MSLVSDAPAASFIPRHVAPGQRFAGAFDFINEGIGLRGWVVDSKVPGRPAAVSAVADGVTLASVHPMIDRPEIDRTLGRLTQAGFLIGWSRFDEASLAAVVLRTPDAALAVRIEETGEFVPCTTVPITAAAALDALRKNPTGDRQARFCEVHEYHAILDSTLFDEAWYRLNYAALIPPGMPPILDYLRRGEPEGRRPSFYFDPLHFSRVAGRVSPRGALAAYLRAGPAGASPGPHFDEAWYRAHHAVPEGTTALGHYLANIGEVAPNRWFDRAYYAGVSDAADAPDLYADFVTIGFDIGLYPSAALASSANGKTLTAQEAAYLTTLRREADPAAPAVVAPAGVPQRCIEAAAPQQPPAAVAPGAQAAPPPASTPHVSSIEPAPQVVPEAPAPQRRSDGAAAPAGPFEPQFRDWSSVGAGAAVPQPALPPPPQSALPPAARIGWSATAAHLKGLSPERRGEAIALAERRLAAGGEGTADAALLLAVARTGERQALAAAKAAAAYLAEPATGEAAVRADVETRLIALAHELYEGRAHREAEQLYRLIFARGRREPLLLLRLVETAVDRGDVAAAAAYVAVLKGSPEAAGNPWTLVAIARFHLLQGAKGEAVRVLAALPPFPATPAIAEQVVIHLLINADAVEAAAARAEASADDPAPMLFAAHFRLAVWRADVRAVLRMAADGRAQNLPDWQLGEAMFRLGAPGRLPHAQQHEVMDVLFRLTEARGLDDNAIVQSRLAYLLHAKRWDDLGALFAALERTPLGTSRETLLRKLEFTAHAGDAAAAEAIYRTHFAAGELNKWESLTVLRLLSELRKWEEAGEVLLRHVAAGYDFGTGGHVAMRVVRKARLHEKVFFARDAAQGAVEAGLDAFLALAGEDMAILNRAIAHTPSARAESARAEGAPLVRKVRYRSNWILDDGPGESSGEYALFVCTNQRYFLSALTFLTSFFGQAPQVDCRLFAFLDGDVPRHWHGMFAMVAARFNRTIEVVPEGEFVAAGTQHRVDYGFFAGGSNLSRAAYFRLYAARYLLQRHAFRRAAYVDTDIICRGDLSGLFELDFGDALIGAAIEDFSVEVVNAAGRNGIDPQKYFNSGVLSLRMDDPNLPGAIDEAIHIAEREPQKLSFHDQCALNIAFEGRFVPLAHRFNFYLRPSRERNGFIEDGLLLHFVDKPKPWDIVFDRSYREEWRVWALMLGTFLPQGLYVDIFSAANRD